MPKAACDTFKALFSKKNDTRLWLLENELLSFIQRDLMNNQYFTKVKSLYHKISELNLNAKIVDSQMRRIIIHGFRPQFASFIATVQGQPTQPSLVDFENLLINQEAMAKQISGTNSKK